MNAWNSTLTASTKRMKRTGRIRPVSKKGRAKAAEWSAITKQAIADVYGRCMARVGQCSGPATDGHHLLKRSRGGLNVRANCLPVCRGCHGWLETHDDEACALGLSYKRHEAPVEIGGTKGA